MIRYTIFVLAIAVSAATAIASLPSHEMPGANGKNVTVLFKSEEWNTAAPLIVEKCAKEDCSDTPAS
jgi:hypothetical protein